MDVKDIITIIEGEVYSVGTGTFVVTIPARVRKTYGIQSGDTLGLALFKHIKKKDIEFNNMVDEVLEDNKPNHIIDNIPIKNRKKFKIL